MTTVYGRPAVEVEQPGGELVAYLVAPAAPAGDEWRAWLVTSPRGDGYRVSEFADGRCTCSCPAWRFDRHGAGRWCVIGEAARVCKHCFAIWNEILNPQTGVASE